MNKYNRPIKEICQANSKFNIIQQKSQTTSSCSANYLLKERKVSKHQKSKQKKYSPMDDHNKNLRNLYKNHIGSQNIERQQLLDKENYLKLYSCNNEKNNENSKSNNVSHGGLAYNDRDNLDDTGSGRCLQNDLIENQCDANDLEQEQSIFCTTYNQYHSVNSDLSNFNIKTHSGNTVNSNNNISDNIDRTKDQNIIAEGQVDNAADGDVEGDEEEDGNNCEEGATTKKTYRSDDFLNENTTSTKFNTNVNSDRDCNIRGAEEEEKEKDLSPHLKYLTSPLATLPSQAALTTFFETETIPPPTTQVQCGVSQHLNHQQFINNVGQNILSGQQIRVQNILDVAGSLCATEPMGALCDMAAYSKMDCSPHDNNHKDEVQNSTDILSKKYYHPLYAHGVCRWPGCELPLENMATFVKHLKNEHCLDDRSTAQARVQMQVVSQLEMHLQKERDRLQAMMHHLYLTKHFVMPDESQQNLSHIRYKNAMRSLNSTPDINKSNNNSNDDSDTTNDLQTLLMSSGNLSSTRKRICDKSPLAMAGGLPYMLERAGLDVQQEIQRNREFYKNADVRPPFTYASLIRQVSTELK